MKKFIVRTWHGVVDFFWFYVFLIEESRMQNLDGEWDSYWAKKSRKAELRELKAEYRRNKAEIRNKWAMHE